MSLEDKLQRLPDRPGVYIYRDAKAQVIYVGKAASLRSRVRSYFQEARPHDPKTDALVRQIADLDYVVTDNELEALMLEANLVRKHRPRYNIILRDDKHYPFLKLTTSEDVSAAAGRPPRAERPRHLLRAVLSGHRHAGDAAADPPALSAAHLLDHDRRAPGAAVHPVRDPPLQRAVHGLGDARGLRANGARRSALPRGP